LARARLSLRSWIGTRLALRLLATSLLGIFSALRSVLLLLVLLFRLWLILLGHV
jgi:hypothetical protein